MRPRFVTIQQRVLSNSEELRERQHDLTLSPPKFNFEVSSNIVSYLYKAHSSTISVLTIHDCKYFEEKIIVVFAICIHSVKVRKCVCPKSLQSCPALWDLMDCSSPGSSVHGDSPGKNTGVNGHALLQGIFPIQGSNLFLSHLPHWQMGSLPTGTTWEAQTMYYRPEITIFLISSTILENKCHVHFTEDKTETWGSEITSG